MRAPFASWLGPIPRTNYRPGDTKAKITLVVHHAVGSIASANARFQSVGAEASAHFGVAYDGTVYQWVDTADVAYAQCDGNYDGTVSVENESTDVSPLTAAQIASVARLGDWLGVAPKLAVSRVSGGIAYHRQFGGLCEVAWGQTECPGDAIVAQIGDIIAAMAGPVPPPPPSERVDVFYKTTDAAKITYYREARGYLLTITDDVAAKYLFAGVPLIDLGGGLAAVAWNAATKAQFVKIGVAP